MGLKSMSYYLEQKKGIQERNFFDSINWLKKKKRWFSFSLASCLAIHQLKLAFHLKLMHNIKTGFTSYFWWLHQRPFLLSPPLSLLPLSIPLSFFYSLSLSSSLSFFLPFSLFSFPLFLSLTSSLSTSFSLFLTFSHEGDSCAQK